MDMTAILFNGAETFEKITKPFAEAHMRNLVKIGQTVSEKTFIKITWFYT